MPSSAQLTRDRVGLEPKFQYRTSRGTVALTSGYARVLQAGTGINLLQLKGTYLRENVAPGGFFLGASWRPPGELPEIKSG